MGVEMGNRREYSIEVIYVKWYNDFQSIIDCQKKRKDEIKNVYSRTNRRIGWKYEPDKSDRLTAWYFDCEKWIIIRKS